MEKCFEKKKDNLQVKLNRADKLTVVQLIHCWTALANKSYITTTYHFHRYWLGDAALLFSNTGTTVRWSMFLTQSLFVKSDNLTENLTSVVRH